MKDISNVNIDGQCCQPAYKCEQLRAELTELREIGRLAFLGWRNQKADCGKRMTALGVATGAYQPKWTKAKEAKP